MTISLIVFVSLQFYWLKEYYASLEQEFSNKVHIALENSAQKISEIEFNKYNEKFKNFDQTLTSNAKKPTLFTVQQIQDSLSKTTLSFGKTIVEKQDIPISKKGDSLTKFKLYKDEGIYSFKKTPTAPQIITSAQSQDISSGLFSLTEFAKFNASNLPINQRVNKKVLDSVLSEELKLQSIDSKFGYGILDKNNKLTSISNNTFLDQKDNKNYTYPLFIDKDDKTLFSLSLVFPRKDASLVKNNLPMLLGTFMSLLTILGIYIISINYMMRQKKISEVKTDFINNMSHEFKTPLATISVATDSLNNDKIATNPENVKYYSQLIKQENLRM
jgi:two-component system phosphate regulon sensor histidine kinase PhoR